MTAINHRRKNKKPINQRYPERAYNNGYASPRNKDKEDPSWRGRIGRTDFLDKSLHGWGHKSEFADTIAGASIGNDFTNGHRGMARSVRGAKKFARTRIRFRENQKLRQIVQGKDDSND